MKIQFKTLLQQKQTLVLKWFPFVTGLNYHSTDQRNLISAYIYNTYWQNTFIDLKLNRSWIFVNSICFIYMQKITAIQYKGILLHACQQQKKNLTNPIISLQQNSIHFFYSFKKILGDLTNMIQSTVARKKFWDEMFFCMPNFLGKYIYKFVALVTRHCVQLIICVAIVNLKKYKVWIWKDESWSLKTSNKIQVFNTWLKYVRYCHTHMLAQGLEQREKYGVTYSAITSKFGIPKPTVDCIVKVEVKMCVMFQVQEPQEKRLNAKMC